LHAIREAAGKITDEQLGVADPAIADVPARNKLRVSIDCRPRPNVADPRNALKLLRDIALLRVDEAPNLVALNTLARQVAKVLVLVVEARRANVAEKLIDCVPAYTCHASNSAEAVSLAEHVEDAGAFFVVQFVHNEHYA
jgi:hypothetical protein